LFIQQACRVLTPQEGKRATIIDFVGNFQRHGLPDVDHEWSLEHKLAPKKHVNDDGTFSIRTCENCYKVFKTANVCPYCGYEYEVKGRELEQVKAVELKRITAQEQEELEQQKKLMRMEVGQCRSYDDLWKIQRQRGYSPAWVYKMAKVKGIRR
jgi:superfamily II DNA or RNA helicase